MAKIKSRRLIVYPKIQLLVLLFIASFGALCSLSTALVSFLLFSPEDRNLQIAALAALSFLAGAVILGLSLYFTNRFLGPIFRLNLEMKRALEEDYKATPFNVRKRDYFKDLAADYSLLIQKMDKDKAAATAAAAFDAAADDYDGDTDSNNKK